MWGQMHADQDPIACIAAARKFVDCLVTEAWPAERPGNPSLSDETEEKDNLEKRMASRPEAKHYFRNR
jgi:hypothetical protein